MLKRQNFQKNKLQIWLFLAILLNLLSKKLFFNFYTKT